MTPSFNVLLFTLLAFEGGATRDDTTDNHQHAFLEENSGDDGRNNENPCAEVPLKYCKKDARYFENKRKKFTKGSTADKNLCHSEGICVPDDTTCVAAYDKARNGKKWCMAVTRPGASPKTEHLEKEENPPPPPARPSLAQSKPARCKEAIDKMGAEEACKLGDCENHPSCQEDPPPPPARPSLAQSKPARCKEAIDKMGAEEACKLGDCENHPSCGEDEELATENVEEVDTPSNPCAKVPLKYCKKDARYFENKRKKFTKGSTADKNLCHSDGICVPDDTTCVADYDKARSGKKWCKARPKN